MRDILTLQLNDVCVQYADAEFALNHLQTTFANGQISLLVGCTGSGKSTLLDALSGLIPLQSGSIYIDKEPLWNGKRANKNYLKQIGISFQSAEQQLFARTVEHEFHYSLHPFHLHKLEVQQRMQDSLTSVHCPDHLIHESPHILSGGQKRKVAIATTIACAPQWFLLDEPSAGLDHDAMIHLTTWLQTWKQTHTTGGILIATHDLDVFLPLADSIALLQHGQIKHHVAIHELYQNPSLLQQIGIALPETLAFYEHLRTIGIQLEARYYAPDELAEHLQHATHPTISESQPTRDMEARMIVCEATHAHLSDREVSEEDPTIFKELTHKEELNFNTKKTLIQRTAHLWTFRTLDPRTKWAICGLLSIGILMQTTSLGLFLAIGVTLLALVWAKLHWSDVKQVTKPFLYVLILSVALASFHLQRTAHFGPWQGFDFAWQPAWITFKGLLKLLCVMQIGILLPATTSQLELKQGLDQLLAPARIFKLPIDAFTLGSSLMLRFIPILLQQVQRFSRIARARGKRTTRFGKIGLRELPAIVIPLLLAVLQIGEELSQAMEVRGYRLAKQTRTTSTRLTFSRRDGYALGWISIVFLCFLLTKVM